MDGARQLRRVVLHLPQARRAQPVDHAGAVADHVGGARGAEVEPDLAHDCGACHRLEAQRLRPLPRELRRHLPRLDEEEVAGGIAPPAQALAGLRLAPLQVGHQPLDFWSTDKELRANVGQFKLDLFVDASGLLHKVVLTTEIAEGTVVNTATITEQNQPHKVYPPTRAWSEPRGPAPSG